MGSLSSQNTGLESGITMGRCWGLHLNPAPAESKVEMIAGNSAIRRAAIELPCHDRKLYVAIIIKRPLFTETAAAGVFVTALSISMTSTFCGQSWLLVTRPRNWKTKVQFLDPIGSLVFSVLVSKLVSR